MSRRLLNKHMFLLEITITFRDKLPHHVIDHDVRAIRFEALGFETLNVCVTYLQSNRLR